MAEYWKIQGEALQDLAMCALLHDNALTQYISEELKKDSVIDLKKDLSEEKTNLHCIYGEKNITKLPFKTDVTNVILYHHEHADGTGPFQKKWNEIPLFARIIHLADIIDIIRNSIDSDDNSWDFMCQYLSQNKDSLFDSECVNAFLHVFTKESYMCLSDDSFETKLWKIIHTRSDHRSACGCIQRRPEPLWLRRRQRPQERRSLCLCLLYTSGLSTAW